MSENLLILLSITALIISFISSLVAYNAYVISKRQLHHPALEYLRRDYRSPEMMLALHILWSFKRTYEPNDKKEKNIDKILSKEYTRIAKEEEKKIDDEKNYDKKMSLIKNSLSYQRRLVISFYYYLYEIWKNKILTETMIFEYWDNMDIFDILKPIEKAQAIIYLDRDDKTKEYIKATEKLLEKLDDFRGASKDYPQHKKSFWK